MHKPRILIPLTIQFSVRYIIRSGLIDKLCETTTPIILLNWHDEIIEQELSRKGISFHYYPGISIGKYYQRNRKFIEIWHTNVVGTPTTKIDDYRNYLLQDRRRDIYVSVRNNIYQKLAKSSFVVQKAIHKEKELLTQDTNIIEFIKIIKKISPDIVFSILPAKQPEELLLRAANLLDIPVITSILSFDNITTHSWMATKFVKYFVWNKYNVLELSRIYPCVHLEDISIVGSPQFDFYYRPEMFMNEQEWRALYKIPEGRPVILFGAGPEVIAPLEPHWLWQLNDAIEKKQIKNDPVILFRRHPVDSIARWESVLSQCKNVIPDDSWHGGKKEIQKTNITQYDLVKLASSLKYCSVHINTSSTMTVDGAIIDRPQIGPAYDDQPGRKFDQAMKDLYQREHYLPITNSGGLDICFSLNEMIEKINNSFDHPEDKKLGRKKIIREICTFDDGKSTERVLNMINAYISGKKD